MARSSPYIHAQRHGALILGHARREVVDAVKERAELSMHTGFPNEPMVDLVEKITYLIDKHCLYYNKNKGSNGRNAGSVLKAL